MNLLSDRLKRLCEVVPACDTLADIGCDHGYVSIELVNSGKVKHILAMDVNKGPLERAKENIENAGLSDKIETRLSNGLHNTSDKEHFDTILIAGMGGRLIRDILTDGSVKVACATCLVLQPQSEIFLVREYLESIGFTISHETCIKDRDKYYFILVCLKGEVRAQEEPFFYEYSQFLLDRKDPTYREYLEKSLKAIRGYILKAGDKSDRLLADRENIEKALSFYQK